MNYKAPRGLFDIVPTPDNQEGWRASHLWNYVENMVRETACSYGYREIRTPLFEQTELFQRGVGEGSDIVTKEMYTFKDKADRSMTLRPEGTAPVIRAFLEHQMQQGGGTHKFFYIAPMFRYERSQAGRYRQHHQFGAEAIGNGSPEQDVELIDLLHTLYQRLGLQKITLFMNSLGDLESRQHFRQALQDFLKANFHKLSPESRMRFETNPLRILDSKDLGDQDLLDGAPSILDFLNSESKDHFHAVLRLLDQLKIPYQINGRCVRGLDYYSRTVFEMTAGELGAQNSVGAGGRYDGLVSTLGGPHLPAIGFGTGIERMIQTLLAQRTPTPPPFSPLLYLIPVGDKARDSCFQLLHYLRGAGISTEMEFSDRKLGKVMRHADQLGAKFVAVLGENELASQEVDLKEMATGEVLRVPLSHLSRILRFEMQRGDLVKVWEELYTPFENKLEAAFFLKRLEKAVTETSYATQELHRAMEKMRQLLEKKHV